MELSDLGKDCLTLIKKKLSKEITGEEYYIGIMELDKKYPHIGFYNSAQRFADKWLRPKLKEKERLPYKDDEYDF